MPAELGNRLLWIKQPIRAPSGTRHWSGSKIAIPIGIMCASSPFLVLKDAHETSYVFARCRVGAGEDRYGQYHSMGISHLLFKVSGNETGGGMFVLEHLHLTPGGPPLHLHLNQE
jgi:hypothetical protein